MKILTNKEEQQLSKEELLEYYKELREYLKNTPIENLTKGALTVCPKINSIVQNVLFNCCGYKIVADYYDPKTGRYVPYEESGADIIDGFVAIYAHTHQSKMDHVNFIATNPNHTILLNSCVLSEFYKKVLAINGVYYVDKTSRESMHNAKTEMIRCLLHGVPVVIFPESAWNCSPNKLLLPFRWGIIDIAKKAQMPIVPVVQEYTYDDDKQDGRERVKKVHVRYGRPIYVSELDDNLEKLEEYREAIVSMRWDLIEEKGLFSRQDIDDFYYANYMKGIIRNLKNAGIDINAEREGIFLANDEFYQFHHINDVPVDENGVLQPTEHVKKLIKLYDENCIA